MFPSHDTSRKKQSRCKKDRRSRYKPTKRKHRLYNSTNFKQKNQKRTYIRQYKTIRCARRTTKNNSRLYQTKTEEIHWNIKLIEKEVDKLSKEIDGLDLDNEIKKETLKNRIKQTSLAIQQTIADIALKGSQGKLNEAEAKAIPEKILQMWSEIGIKQEGVEISRGQMENYALDIANRLHLGEKGLDIQEQRLIIDCITGLLNIAVQGGLTPGW